MLRKQKHKNHLALIRNKNAYRQKQIAALLDHKTTDQLSRYERGTELPSLKIAFNLGIIYNLPLRILFYDYYESCLKELKKRGKKFFKESGFNFIDNSQSSGADFCTYEEKLKSPKVSERELNKIRQHITDLIQNRGEKMNHLTPQ